MIDKIIERLRNTTYPCFDNYGLGFNRGVREAIDIVKQVAAEGGCKHCEGKARTGCICYCPMCGRKLPKPFKESD